MYKVWMSSDVSLGAWYDTDCKSALEWAKQHGRAEEGEIICLYAAKDAPRHLSRCYWDSVHRVYRGF